MKEWTNKFFPPARTSTLSKALKHLSEGVLHSKWITELEGIVFYRYFKLLPLIYILKLIKPSI